MTVLPRYLTETIRTDALAFQKMAFLSGPRQAGKSTIGRALLKHESNEFTWDDEDFRKEWTRSPSASIYAFVSDHGSTKFRGPFEPNLNSIFSISSKFPKGEREWRI